MAEIYGTLKKQGVKQITSNKTGRQFNIHTAELEDTGGTTHTVEFGFNKPTLHEGAFYKMDCKKEYGSLKVTSFEEASAGDAPTPEPAPKYINDRGFVVKMFPVPVDHPDRSIIRQNSLSNAIKLLEMVIPDGEKYSSIEGAAEEAIELAYKLEAYSTGDLEEKALSELLESYPTGKTE